MTKQRTLLQAFGIGAYSPLKQRTITKINRILKREIKEESYLDGYSYLIDIGDNKIEIEKYSDSIGAYDDLWQLTIKNNKNVAVKGNLSEKAVLNELKSILKTIK